MLEAVEEEHDPEQEQDVVVAGDHVLGTEIEEGNQVNTRNFLDIALIAFRDAMRHGIAGHQHQKRDDP